MKSFYNLAQALLGLRHPAEALDTAKYAYRICLETKDSSSEILSQFILRTKQVQWQSKETARLRELNETLGFMENLLQQQLEKDLEDLEWRVSKKEVGETGRNEEKAELENEMLERRRYLRESFRNAEKEETAERVSLVILICRASLIEYLGCAGLPH